MEEINRPALDIGVATFTKPGQNESGDLHIVTPFEGGTLVAVVDGIGHGEEAAKVARITGEVLKSSPGKPLGALIKSCHDELRGTRGVVMSTAVFNRAENVMIWAGVGNVQGTLMPMDKMSRPRTLLLSSGTLGQQLGAVYPTALAVRPGDTLIFTSDGVREDFYQGLNLRQSPQQLANDILTRSVRGTDDAVVLVGRWLL